MKEAIIKHLRELEEEHEVKILFAVESGSRAWGFASADSDYDVRFIYYNKPDAYLRLNEPKQVLEKMIKNQTPEIDIVGWDIKKFGSLFLKSNPTVSEWLTSDVIYIDSPAMQELNKLFTKGFSKTALIKHYTSLARKNYEKYIRKTKEVNLKKYVYILRALACTEYLNKFNNLPPLNYKKIINQLPDYAREFMEHTVELKKKTESMQGTKNQKVDNYIESYFNRKIEKTENKFNTEELNKLIIKIIKSY